MSAGICQHCNGMGWRNCGWTTWPAVNGIICDVAIVDWRRCLPCSGSGVFVSRERAGLASQAMQPDSRA